MESENVSRKEIVAAVEKVRRDSGSEHALGNGCCVIEKGITQQCFDDFTKDMCDQAANACGGIGTFAPGQTCRQQPKR
ncbi:hypothetical protein [Caballeronia sp. KNU42]